MIRGERTETIDSTLESFICRSARHLHPKHIRENGVTEVENWLAPHTGRTPKRHCRGFYAKKRAIRVIRVLFQKKVVYQNQ